MKISKLKLQRRMACSSPAKLSPSDDDSHNYDEFSIDDGTRDMTDEEMSEYVRAFKETEV